MLNNLQIIGNVGKLETKSTPSGKFVCEFSVAVNDNYKDKKDVVWFDVVAWDKLGELCGNYLQKGKQVYVSGSIKEEKWTGKDGVEKKRWRVVANKVLFLSPAQKKEEQSLSGLDDLQSGLSFENRALDNDLDNIPF